MTRRDDEPSRAERIAIAAAGAFLGVFGGHLFVAALDAGASTLAEPSLSEPTCAIEQTAPDAAAHGRIAAWHGP